MLAKIRPVRVSRGGRCCARLTRRFYKACAITRFRNQFARGQKTIGSHLKVESDHGVLLKLRLKSTIPTSNDILSEQWVGLLSSLTLSSDKFKFGVGGCNHFQNSPCPAVSYFFDFE